jgi:glutaminyl-peptide cyclotransferase
MKIWIFAISALLGGVIIACAGDAKPKFNSARAFGDLVAQCEFGPRAPNTAAHDKALQYLYKSLASTTDLCRLQKFSYFDSLTGNTLALANLIASYNAKSGKRIMLCAHWDSRPRADNDSDSTKKNLPIPGANDGASGTAILLELGRLFRDIPPPIGVDIVLFDGEDYGLSGQEAGWFLGSSYFAQNLHGYWPRMAILLDMVGDSSLAIYREGYSQRYAGDINDYIWKIAGETGSFAFIDSVKHTVSDDHIPLLTHGMKAIDLIDFDYHFWHTQSDTPDKCSEKSLLQVGNVLISAIYDKRIEKF